MPGCQCLTTFIFQWLLFHGGDKFLSVALPGHILSTEEAGFEPAVGALTVRCLTSLAIPHYVTSSCRAHQGQP
jgi:hypothetical protein